MLQAGEGVLVPLESQELEGLPRGEEPCSFTPRQYLYSQSQAVRAKHHAPDVREPVRAEAF